jgi:hypothetical protein
MCHVLASAAVRSAVSAAVAAMEDRSAAPPLLRPVDAPSPRRLGALGSGDPNKDVFSFSATTAAREGSVPVGLQRESAGARDTRGAGWRGGNATRRMEGCIEPFSRRGGVTQRSLRRRNCFSRARPWSA